MQGNPSVIKTLQAAMPAEAHLNLQYRMDQRLAHFMGYKKIAKDFEQFGDDAHTFLKKVSKQLLWLSGDGDVPTAEYAISKITEPGSIPDMCEAAQALETGICEAYEKAIQVCVAALDDETRNLYEHLIKWHHHHLRWLEKQARLVEDLGLAQFLAEQL